MRGRVGSEVCVHSWPTVIDVAAAALSETGRQSRVGALYGKDPLWTESASRRLVAAFDAVPIS
ncbi:hypothetical protein RM788_45710 [Umezawaea sp. Da 62-37]|nr:hypothetical protein [Umezawaea sp. Da 62-37]WNV85343.1 hypothetical protein RM788_45710 [Umezawaea sp. Da 62-37]